VTPPPGFVIDPPKGFVLDAPTPEPPRGFVLDAAPAKRAPARKAPVKPAPTHSPGWEPYTGYALQETLKARKTPPLSWPEPEGFTVGETTKPGKPMEIPKGAFPTAPSLEAGEGGPGKAPRPRVSTYSVAKPKAEWPEAEFDREAVMEAHDLSALQRAQLALSEQEGRVRNPVLRAIAGGVIQGALDVKSLMLRITGQPIRAGQLTRQTKLRERVAHNIDEAQIGGMSRAAGMLRGATRSVTMAAPASLTGPFAAPAAIYGFAAVRANQAATEAKDGGLYGASAADYVLKAAAIEGGVAAVFHAMGLGGMESMLTGGLQGGAKQIAGQIAARAIQEVPEEILTEFADHMNQEAHGLAAPLTSEGARNLLIDTTAQTLLCVGMLGAPSLANSAAKPEIRAELVESVSEAYDISASQASDAIQEAERAAHGAEGSQIDRAKGMMAEINSLIHRRYSADLTPAEQTTVTPAEGEGFGPVQAEAAVQPEGELYAVPKREAAEAPAREAPEAGAEVGREVRRQGAQEAEEEVGEIAPEGHPDDGPFGAYAKGDEWHKGAVESAIREGKPVPPEVLADYPDLQPAQKAAPKQKTPHTVWSASSGATGTKGWFVSRESPEGGQEVLRDSAGRMRTFATQQAAERAAANTGEAYFALGTGVVEPEAAPGETREIPQETVEAANARRERTRQALVDQGHKVLKRQPRSEAEEAKYHRMGYRPSLLTVEGEMQPNALGVWSKAPKTPSPAKKDTIFAARRDAKAAGIDVSDIKGEGSVKRIRARIAERIQAGFTPDPTEPVAQDARKAGGFAAIGPKQSQGAARPWLTLERTRSPDAGIEAFFGRTNKLTSVTSKLRRAAAAVTHGLVERFRFLPHLPKSPEAAFARDAIRTMPEQTRGAAATAAGDLAAILEGDGTRQALDVAGLDLLRRKVFIEDLISEAHKAMDAGENSAVRLPEGVTLTSLQTDKARIDALIDKVPSVADAYEKRQELWQSVSKDLAERGVISEEAAENATYVRHFVLDYIERKNIGGSGLGKVLKKPFRAYSRRRKGTRRDISTDYLEVEMKALGDIYRDNAIEDLAQSIARRYDQTTEMKALAKESQTGATVQQLAAQNGLVEWQYQRGNIFYQAKTITEAEILRLAEDTLNDPALADEIGVPLSAMRDGLVLGGKRKTFLIPDWLADQLNDLPVRHRPGVAVSFTEPFIKFWKRWILRVNPIRYNSRNAVGDGERVNAAGRAHAFARVPEAVKMLAQKTSPEAHPEAYEMGEAYGVFGSSLWHEMGTARTRPEFARFEKVTSQSGWNKAVRAMKWPGRKAGGAAQVIQDLTQAREDVLRVAVYLDALDQVDAYLNDGTPIRHWNGSQADIHALAKEDKFRAAAKISRETLGDYGAFTPWENDHLRNGLIPFWSWMRLNGEFWPRVLKSAAGEDAAKAKAGALRAGARGAYGLGKWCARIGTGYALITAWNNGDEERQKKERALPAWLRARPHIIVGDGVVHTPSALSDWLEWFGLQEIGVDLRRWESGQITTGELATLIMVTEARAPVNRVWQSLNPYLKAPMTLTGAKTFPDVFDSYTFAKSFSSRAVAETVLNILGPDTKRFLDAAQGRRTLREVLSYYFSGSAYTPASAAELANEIKRRLSKATLKRQSRTTGRGPGEAKAGRERDVDELRNRLKGLR